MTDAAADRGGLIQPTPPHHWCPRGRDAMGSKASLDGMPFRQMLQTMTQAFRKRDLEDLRPPP
jgi:hypothetical protein